MKHTDSYFLCPVCGLYTVASWWDNFTGVESKSLSGPAAKQEGDERIALIRQCSRPWTRNADARRTEGISMIPLIER